MPSKLTASRILTIVSKIKVASNILEKSCSQVPLFSIFYIYVHIPCCTCAFASFFVLKLKKKVKKKINFTNSHEVSYK